MRVDCLYIYVLISQEVAGLGRPATVADFESHGVSIEQILGEVTYFSLSQLILFYVHFLRPSLSLNPNIYVFLLGGAGLRLAKVIMARSARTGNIGAALRTVASGQVRLRTQGSLFTCSSKE